MAVIKNIFHGNTISKEGKIIGIWPNVNIVFFPDKLKNLQGKGMLSFHFVNLET